MSMEEKLLELQRALREPTTSQAEIDALIREVHGIELDEAVSEIGRRNRVADPSGRHQAVSCV